MQWRQGTIEELSGRELMRFPRTVQVLGYAVGRRKPSDWAMTKVVEHKAAQRAEEGAKQELAEQRAASSGMHVVPKLA